MYTARVRFPQSEEAKVVGEYSINAGYNGDHLASCITFSTDTPCLSHPENRGGGFGDAEEVLKNLLGRWENDGKFRRDTLCATTIKNIFAVDKNLGIIAAC